MNGADDPSVRGNGWGRGEYSTAVPWWLRFGLLFAALIALGSDIRIIMESPQSPLLLWIVADFVLSYVAAGISLISARASVILCALGMATAFVTHRPTVVLLSASVIALVVAALCRSRLLVAHCGATLVWVSLMVWFIGIHRMDDTMAFWWVAVTAIGVAVLVGLALKYLVIRTAKTHARLRVVEARQAEIRKEERQDLARELHDVVAHHITVITMQVMSRRHSHDPDELRETLGIIDDSAREALAELRALLDVLRTDEDSEPRVSANQIMTSASVGEQVEQLARSLSGSGFQMREVFVDPRIESQPFSVRTTCARIVQESTTNIMKHAHLGAACSISLTVAPSEVAITITNDRVKPRKNAEAGYGLIGLRERVLAVGGSYAAGVRGDKWVVEVHLPIQSSGASV